MVNITNRLFFLKNIKEIKFTRVEEADDIFALTIECDVAHIGKGEILKKQIVEAELCKLDSVFEIRMDSELKTNVSFENEIISSRLTTIPLTVRILKNKRLNELFRMRNKTSDWKVKNKSETS